MARIRSVKPEVATHEGLFEMEMRSKLPVRFAWVMLWTHCDGEGRFEWRPRRLKLGILPYDDGVNFEEILALLESAGMIVSYTVDGKKFGYIPTWKKHQRIDGRIEPRSRIPGPPDEVAPESRDDSQEVVPDSRSDFAETAPESRDDSQESPAQSCDDFGLADQNLHVGMEGKGMGIGRGRERTAPPWKQMPLHPNSKKRKRV